ncbi:MAG: AAA family ATPase [Flavobacteriales bacterium AspAUS03]
MFSPKINCFVSQNGVGKTNLLNPIHYLSFGKSYFHLSDQQNICFEEDFFLIEKSFEKNGCEKIVNYALREDEKKTLKKTTRSTPIWLIR